MLYRDIPLVLFNYITIEASRRPFEPDRNHYLISQIGQLKTSNINAVALYEFNDTIPRFASAHLGIYSSDLIVTSDQRKPFFSVDTAIVEKGWLAGKGYLFKADISVFVGELKLNETPNSLVGLITELIKQSAYYHYSAIREEYWEIEMNPGKDYSNQHE